MKTEQWKKLNTINSNYEVSNLGRLRKSKTDGSYAILNGSTTQKHGNYHFHVIEGKKYYTHRLVMLAFVGECPKGHEVDHIDRNSLNNELSNLRYLLRRDNRKGTAKLTKEKVKAILMLTAIEGLTQKAIGNLFGVHHSTISNITTGKTWEDV